MYTSYGDWPTISIINPLTLNIDVSYHEISLTNCKLQIKQTIRQLENKYLNKILYSF